MTENSLAPKRFLCHRDAYGSVTLSKPAIQYLADRAVERVAAGMKRLAGKAGLRFGDGLSVTYSATITESSGSGSRVWVSFDDARVARPS